MLSDTSVWKLPAADVRLAGDEIHIWRAALDHRALDIPQFEQVLLSKDERVRAARLRFTRDRRRYIAGRGILRLILGSYLGCRPAELAFSYGKNGKPVLAGPGESAPALFFNVTHSEALALYAITRVGDVGIDVERVREIAEWAQIASLCFTPEENSRLHAAAATERGKIFFQAWTRKEAMAKASGRGLTDLNDIGDGSDVTAVEALPGVAVHALAPAPEYVASLAVAGPAHRLVCMTWQQRDIRVPLRPRLPFLRSAARSGAGSRSPFSAARISDKRTARTE